MRKTPMPPRTSYLKSGGPIKPKKRKPSEFTRIYGSRARVRWVKSLPCLACVALHPAFVVTAGNSHNAHTETGGMGYKADHRTIVPLCAVHHRRYDEHQTPFDTEGAREAMKRQAPIIAAEWDRRSA